MPAKKTSSNGSKTTAVKAKTSTTSKSTAAKTKKPVLADLDNPQVYFCFWRLVKTKNEKTKKTEEVKTWFVIKDGAKSYEKFASQQAAIKSFRKLKEHAIMKVQSVDSDQVAYNVATVLLLEHQGHAVKGLKAEPGAKKANENENYQDQYVQFDPLKNEASDFLDHATYNELFAKKEGKKLIPLTVNETMNATTSEEVLPAEETSQQEVTEMMPSTASMQSEMPNDSETMAPEEEMVQEPNQMTVEESPMVTGEPMTQEAIMPVEQANFQSSSMTFEEPTEKSYIVDPEMPMMPTETTDVDQAEETESTETVEEKDHKCTPTKKNIIYWSVIGLILAVIITIVVLVIVFNIPTN